MSKTVLRGTKGCFDRREGVYRVGSQVPFRQQGKAGF